MIRTTAALTILALFSVGAANADYTVTGEGTWPKSWPTELEPLRKQASSFEGPLAPHQHYAITFSNREEFESAWPHFLKVKSKGAPIRLVRGPNFFLGEKTKAGVVIHAPPPGEAAATYIELLVDGDVVNLNRIPLPADAPIIDKRFGNGKTQ